jgi:hypothetical protein
VTILKTGRSSGACPAFEESSAEGALGTTTGQREMRVADNAIRRHREVLRRCWSKDCLMSASIAALGRPAQARIAGMSGMDASAPRPAGTGFRCMPGATGQHDDQGTPREQEGETRPRPRHGQNLHVMFAVKNENRASS